VTEWPEFGELDLSSVAARMRGSVLVDGRNFFDPESVREAGLIYEGIGRAVSDGQPAEPAVVMDASAHPGGR
jgi:UDPglucose 6-dehydrogenase